MALVLNKYDRSRHDRSMTGSRYWAMLARACHAPLLLAAVTAIGLGAVDSLAQSREVLIGTTRVGPSPDQEIDRATRMLEEGIRAIERGDVMLGRRRLEALLTRYPQTLAAVAAKGALQSLSGSTRNLFQPGTVSDVAEILPSQTTEPGSNEAPPYLGGSRAEDMTRSRTETNARAVEQLRRVQDERRQQQLSERFQNDVGDRVFFPELGVDLGARARVVLVSQAAWLMKHPDVTAVVESHADDTGLHEQDYLLAERRAAAVRTRLIEEGVPAARVQVRVHGRDQPIAICSSSECRAQNRRVITRIGSATEPDQARRGRTPEGMSAQWQRDEIGRANKSR